MWLIKANDIGISNCNDFNVYRNFMFIVKDNKRSLSTDDPHCNVDLINKPNPIVVLMKLDLAIGNIDKQ